MTVSSVVILFVSLLNCFGSTNSFSLVDHLRQSRVEHFSTKRSATNGESNFVGHVPKDDNSESDNLLVQSPSRLSHVMLQVPSVDTTVAYWENTARGKVTRSSKLDDKSNKSDDEDQLRKLVQFQTTKEDLIGVISGTAPQLEDTDLEPNGIPIQSCAAAPGDFFARFCMHTSDMEATCQFYIDILGMSVAAIDEKMVCLRYDESKKKKDDKDSSKPAFFGVPTTLVFEPQEEEIQVGNCFDHFVIATEADIDSVYQQLEQKLEESNLKCPLFMKPTEMFGKKVMGVMDPCGYKVILAGEA